MDPDAALRDAIDAAREGELSTLSQCVGDLFLWTLRGGRPAGRISDANYLVLSQSLATLTDLVEAVRRLPGR